MLYNFPKEQFDDFKLFITEGSGIDIEILLEQLSLSYYGKNYYKKNFHQKLL